MKIYALYHNRVSSARKDVVNQKEVEPQDPFEAQLRRW